MKQCLAVLFLLFSSLFSHGTVLTPQDVHPVIDQLLELHIDQEKISPEILGRSLTVYLNQFDPSHSYLILEEVAPYTRPSGRALQAMQREYEEESFATYYKLNESIQKGITRARGWRADWQENPQQLVAEAAKSEFSANEKNYPSTLNDLRDRHRARFLAFLSLQMDELGEKAYQGKEAQLVALCEKQLRIIEDEYLAGHDQEHHVILRTLKALAHSLDAHTAYYSPDEAFAMKVQLEKGMCGIGVVMREGIDGITIHEVLAGGPAEKSGQIEAGDTIVEVDGKPIDGHSFQHVMEMMRGKEGSRTHLGIVRNGAHRHVELVRQKIVIDDKRVDVSSEPYGDGVIGKITLHSFYEGENGLSSEQDLKAAIDELREQGPLYGLVLDMRNNGGGFLTQAVKVSGLFISSGVVVISKYSDGTKKYFRAVDGERYYDGPLVVLVNRGSASATEIVAQTLQDYGVAVVVGDEQTYGKGTIQHQTITGGRSESFFKVTVGRYYTVSGKSTQIDGVKADIIVPTALQYEELGEGYLDYPLPPDTVPAAFEDTLSDLDPFARKWFQKFYTSTLQPREQTWEGLMPQLAENSQRRVAQNKNYQLFIEKISAKKEVEFGSNDLQMEESVNIVKDMIFLNQ